MSKRRISLLLLLWASSAFGELEPEVLRTERLPDGPHPHWIWVNNVNFYSLLDGKAYLLDGDSGWFLGMLGLGFFHNKLLFSASGDKIYSTQTYYSRGSYGEHSDFVGIYDATTLAPVAEIEIPGKRLTGMPTQGHTALTDVDRFMLISNFTPAQSVIVVDPKARQTLGEIETAGCTLVYPFGEREFFTICGDGSLLSLQLDDRGRELNRSLTKPVFDPVGDAIEEDGVRVGDQWLFVSRRGHIHTFTPANGTMQADEPWSRDRKINL